MRSNKKGYDVMTTLLECLQEVIAKGPGFVIHSSLRAGANSTSDWDPAALLADIQFESPLVLTDHAWTDWTILTDGSQSCTIPYGVRGSTSGQRGIPGYGTLRVYTSAHMQMDGRVDRPVTTEFRFAY
jgi:hypothetical protein